MICVQKGLLVLFGIFFAWETRKVHVEVLNDSKQIGMCVYNVMIISVVTVVLQYILDPSEQVLAFVTLVTGVMLCSFITILIDSKN